MDIATLGLRVDGSGAVRTVDAFTASATRAAAAGAAAESTATRLRASFGRLAALVGAGALFGAVVKNTEEAQYAMAALESGVRSTGGAAGFSAQQLASMASELQGISEISDEAISRAQALMLTFTNVRGDVFKDATVAVLDLSQRMGGDLKGASIQVGKALQDPIRGILALRRVGVSFSESQRELIKDLVNTGRVVDAQRLILRELQTEFGGSAAAARNTLGGALKGLRNDFGDLMEVSADGSSGIVGWINKLDGLLLFLKDHLDAVQKTVAYGIGFWITYTVVVKAHAAITLLMTAYTAANTAAIAAQGVAAGRTAVAIGVLSAAGRGLVAILTGPVGIALALTAVIGLLVNYKTASDRAAESNKRFADSLAGVTAEQLAAAGANARVKMEGVQAEMARLEAANERFANRRVTVRLGGVNPLLTTTIRGETDAYLAQRKELERLQASYAAVGLEMKRRQGASATVPPMVDVSTRDKSAEDAIRNRLQQNREMVEAARQGVALAAEQGVVQDRLRIAFEATNQEMAARADLTTRSVLPATLAAIRAERDLKLQALDVTALTAQARAREDAQRTQQQSINLATAEGTAQTRLRIEYDALNKTIEARNRLGEGKAFDNTVEDIERERLHRLAEERLKIVQGYQQQMRGVFAGFVEDLTQNGIKAFGNLFATIRQMFFRMVADLAARKFMQAIGNNLAGGLAKAFGGVDKLNDGGQSRAAVALNGSASALSGAAAALTAAAARLGATGGVPGAGGRPPTELEPLVVTAQQKNAQSFAKTFAKYAGPALAGFFAGSAFGSSTSNRSLGTLGGAASGAAAGYAMGGPIGAAIGGLSGAIGGFLGASKRREQEEKALREVLNRNGERIKELSENIAGFTLTSGKNLAAAARISAALTAGRSDGGYIDFGSTGIGSKALGEALKGGATPENMRKIEAQFGVTLQDVGRMARQFGIELFDGAGKLIPAALGQLNEAILLTIKTATTFTNSMDDLRLRQEAYNKLFDVPDTPINRLNDFYERLTKGAPDLIKQMGLANLNLATEAGRKVLLSGLQDIFKLIDSGLLTPEMLGAFGDKEGLLRALLDAKDGLDAFRNTLGSVTTDFPRAMDLILYEQRYGRGTGSMSERANPLAPPVRPPDVNPGGVTKGPRAPLTFNVYISNEAGDSDETLIRKVETGAVKELARGGFSNIETAAI